VFAIMGIFDRHSLTDEQIKNYDETAFKKFVRNKVATEDLFGAKAEELQKKIIRFYLGEDNGKQKDHLFYLEQYAMLISDLLFVVPQLREMRYKSEHGWPVYMLKFTHWKELVFSKNAGIIKKTTHGQEYGVLFGVQTAHTTPFNEDDLKNKRLVVDAIVNFVKTKSPRSDEQPNFEPLSQKHPLVYSEISTKVELKGAMFGEAFNFWNDVSSTYDFDLVRGIHKKTLRSRSEL